MSAGQRWTETTEGELGEADQRLCGAEAKGAAGDQPKLGIERLHAAVVDAIPSLNAVWIVNNLEASPDISTIARSTLLNDVLAEHEAVTKPEFPRFPFDNPLYILLSTGTTRLPN